MAVKNCGNYVNKVDLDKFHETIKSHTSLSTAPPFFFSPRYNMLT